MTYRELIKNLGGRRGRSVCWCLGGEGLEGRGRGGGGGGEEGVA